ncbi:MAG TPA: GTPase ObgE [Nitriliruptorales bacterium]
MQTIEFVDECTVQLRGGDGGNGAVSMRREAHVPRGGPNGGDGGRGGDVILQADTNTTSLLDLHRNPHRRAVNGAHGEGLNRTGASGQDTVVRVPVGTVVRDQATGVALADLTGGGQRFVAARGGRGGRGNASFKNRYRRVPQFAELGEHVDERRLRLELKLIADVGLVGYPSSGKSSLIARLSGARPKIGDYPFTTLTPNLGVMRAGDTDVVLADVPGLIEGASEGKGLGHQFLRHIERCHVVLHVLDTFPLEPDRDPVQDLRVIVGELREHDASLLERPALVALNKIDLPDGRAMASLVREQLEDAGHEVYEVSAVSGEGLDPLRYRLGELVAAQRAHHEAEQAMTSELVIRLPEDEGGFDVVRQDDLYRVAGRRVERWVQMTPLSNPEAARYLQGRLRRAGVEKALVAAGAREGDDVAIGDAVFEFSPDITDLPEDEREAILAGELDEEPDLDEADLEALGDVVHGDADAR